ncbi:CPCC family cysteine-rich protein [Marinobacter litoralis]|nr:CPCC family cysteine-rich protein [Marinobacter litoralis]
MSSSDWREERPVEFERRRAFFMAAGGPVVLNKRTKVERVPCPCCGYPTLKQRGRYEICCLCIWEDDGEDDDNTHQWGGGPNGEYTLTEARANVRAFGTMYNPKRNTTLTGNDGPEVLSLKQELRALFDGLLSLPDNERASHWKSILDKERALRKAEQRQMTLARGRG